MRIISGQFKGRVLARFKGQHIRPTTDRVKESIFNKVVFQLKNAVVLDLFAGTGSLGFEALSRGGQSVCFVDKHAQSISLIKKNKALLSPDLNISCCQCDVFAFLRRPAKGPFDLIFIDPPFTQKLAHRTLQALSQSSCMGKGACVVIEAGRDEQLQKQYEALQLYDHKHYGDKQVAFYESLLPVQAWSRIFQNHIL